MFNPHAFIARILVPLAGGFFADPQLKVIGPLAKELWPFNFSYVPRRKKTFFGAFNFLVNKIIFFYRFAAKRPLSVFAREDGRSRLAKTCLASAGRAAIFAEVRAGLQPKIAEGFFRSGSPPFLLVLEAAI